MMKFNFSPSFENFVKKDAGAAALEAALSFCVFVMICTALIDFSNVMLKNSYMNRVNATLANIIRERAALYDGREQLSQNDVNDLYQLSQKLTGSSFQINKDYFIDIRAVYFVHDKNELRKEISSTQTYRSPRHSCESAIPKADSKTLQDLSVFVPDTQWLPVYQITLCMPGAESFYMRTLGLFKWDMPDILVKNAVVARLF